MNWLNLITKLLFNVRRVIPPLPPVFKLSSPDPQPSYQSTGPFIPIDSYLFLSIPVYSYLFLPIPVYSCLFLSNPIYSCLQTIII